MIWVLDDHVGLPDTLPVLNVLDGGKLIPSNSPSRPHHPLQGLAIQGGTVPSSGHNASRQGALSSDPVKGL